ncbi:hypothetical protein D3C80_1303340 [compost metagenome]
MVDQRANQRKHLERQGETEDPAQRRFQALSLANKIEQADLFSLIFDRKLVRGRQFHGNAGKVTVRFPQAHGYRTTSRIVQFQPLPSHPFEYRKVIHVPVQNAGHRQQVQFFELQLHGATT